MKSLSSNHILLVGSALTLLALVVVSIEVGMRVDGAADAKGTCLAKEYGERVSHWKANPPFGHAR